MPLKSYSLLPSLSSRNYFWFINQALKPFVHIMIFNSDIIRISVTQIWDCIYASKKRYCKQVPMTSKTKKSRKWLDFNYTPQFTSFCDNFIPYIKSRVLYSKNHFMDTFITLQYKFVYRTSFYIYKHTHGYCRKELKEIYLARKVIQVTSI